MEINRSKRDLSLDVLRIIAALMVVGIHTAMAGWYNISPRTYNWTVLNFYDTLFRPAVPLFVMISGSLFLRKKQIDLRHLWLGNILRLVSLYIFWVVFYAVMNNGIHKSIADPSIILNEVTGPNPQYHLWYLRMLINLYAIAPLLFLLVRAMDEKNCRYYFLLFFVFGILRHTVSDLPFLPKRILEQINLFIDMDLVGYAGYFILGFFLSTEPLPKRLTQRKVLFIYILTVILAAGLNQWIAAAQDWPTQALYGNFSLPVFIESVCIFILIRNRFSKRAFSESAEDWVIRVSESTLCIYLLHPFVLNRLEIHFGLRTTNYNVLFSVPLMVCFVFVLCSITGMILKRIPVLKKLV